MKESHMLTFILVSHSKKITDGLKEMIEEMIGDRENITIVSAGGTDTGDLGTDPIRIVTEIEEHVESDQIYLFADIGSAVMSIESALDLVNENLRERCVYIDGPLVEGAFVACVQGMIGSSKEVIQLEVNKLYSKVE